MTPENDHPPATMINHPLQHPPGIRCCCKRSHQETAHQKDYLMKPYVTKRTISSKAKNWLQKISPFNTHQMQLNRDKAALLVIDMQLFFLDPASPSFTCGGLAILPRIQKVIHAFRKARRPVIFTRHVHHPDLLDAGITGWWWEGMCMERSPESEIHRDIYPEPNEKIIFKHRYSAFYNTDLETVLRCLQVEDLVVTGIMTNMCCESTARDAYFRDYRVFFLADGTGSITEEMQLASLLNLAFGFSWVTDVDTVVSQLCEESSPNKKSTGEYRQARLPRREPGL
jgi:nicotinamidase-related amidase